MKTPILLWDVYVPLRANVAGLGMRDMGMGERGDFEDFRDISIEQAVQMAADKRYNGLVILGDPGAGKTTLHEDNNYWRTEAQSSAEELYDRIEGNESYLKLAINPLMLQLIALVNYDFKTVPDRRVELYEKCTDLLLQKWDEAKGLKTLLSANEARS